MLVFVILFLRVGEIICHRGSRGTTVFNIPRRVVSIGVPFLLDQRTIPSLGFCAIIKVTLSYAGWRRHRSGARSRSQDASRSRNPFRSATSRKFSTKARMSQ
ncbi:MAG: hypothetical protein JWN92_2916 [Candidatus Acidoferrum typicum]|nr:hypothetical protein [Candidatus Acidoferrum typicum]